MSGTNKTRTQRRMEKRQTIILLVLVLAVSLASFTLGVIVGRRGAERDLAQRLSQTEKVLVAQAPMATVEPTVKDEGQKIPVAPAPEPAAEEPELSFYDNLAKETAPLGSGINLAPEEAQALKEATAQPPIDLPAQPIVVKAKKVETAPSSRQEKAVDAVAPVVATAVEGRGTQTTTAPTVAPNGTHAVQIGSFNSAGDAIALKQKMLEMEYPAFVVEADLGKKGLWYRVRVGPYADSNKAKQMQQLLEDKEKIKGFVSRR